MTPLSVLVCGSVDNGKSTLVGRMLLALDAVLPERWSGDLAHLTDGLEAERAQGITIDVGHRQVQGATRRLHLLDCPGHDQYTRNMATAASQADVAVALVDAARGLSRQTRRHVRIAQAMGVRALVFAVNKMDLVGFAAARFAALQAEIRAVAPDASVLPVCALDGGGILRPDPRMPWYTGPALLPCLEAVHLPHRAAAPFRMPVQTVLDGPGGTRLLAGTVISGRIAPGDAVGLHGAPATTVRVIEGPGGTQATAEAGDAVAIGLETAPDAARGDVLAAAAHPVPMTRHAAARLIWCGPAPLNPAQPYLFKLGAATVSGRIVRTETVLDVETGAATPAAAVAANDIADVRLGFDAPLPLEPFADSPALGGFIVMDAATHDTVAAGMVTRAGEPAAVTGGARARLMRQRPAVVWFTGLSGAGKSTVAAGVDALLHAAGRHTALLDGDVMRQGLCRGLGFSRADRAENVRRVGEVAALMAEAGLIVLVALISPYRADRDAVRRRVGPAFLEVFVDAPVETCRARDPKGLYRQAESGTLPAFTGVSDPYEPPVAPELHLRTAAIGPEDAAAAVLAALAARQDAGGVA